KRAEKSTFSRRVESQNRRDRVRRGASEQPIANASQTQHQARRFDSKRDSASPSVTTDALNDGSEPPPIVLLPMISQTSSSLVQDFEIAEVSMTQAVIVAESFRERRLERGVNLG